MILSTTAMIEGRPVREYLGIVTGRGHRADAVIGIDTDDEVVGKAGSMLMVTVRDSVILG